MNARVATGMASRWLLLASVLPACTLTPAAGGRAFALCPADPSEWTVLREPPPNAAALIAEARPDRSAPRGAPRPRLYWFRNAQGDLLMCLPDLQDHCVDRAWRFSRQGDRWVLDPLQTITYCG